MKRLFLALLLAALLPAFALAEAPPEGALVLDGQMEGTLFLPDGRVVYVPVKKDGDHFLPSDEIRCVDAGGNLLWASSLPPGKLWWGGPHQLPDGRIGLVMVERDWRQGVLYLLGPSGKLLHSQKLPSGFRPLMLSGEWVYGTDEGFHLHTIDFEGKAIPHQLPVLGDEAVILWTWPREGGQFVVARRQLSGEEDFAQRRSDQLLLYRDTSGAYAHQAVLKAQSGIGGFLSDAVLLPKGGITALAKNDDHANRDNEFSLISFDEEGQPVWRKVYALDALTCRANLIDLSPEGGYTLWGMGKMAELDSTGFVFRMDVDEKGNPLSLSARHSPGSLMVRYLEGRAYVHNPWGSKSWVAPFEALPETELRLK